MSWVVWEQLVEPAFCLGWWLCCKAVPSGLWWTLTASCRLSKAFLYTHQCIARPHDNELSLALGCH